MKRADDTSRFDFRGEQAALQQRIQREDAESGDASSKEGSPAEMGAVNFG